MLHYLTISAGFDAGGLACREPKAGGAVAAGSQAISIPRLRDALAVPLPTFRRAAVIATTGEGRVVFWNAGAERLYGWPARAAMARNVTDLICPAQAYQQAAEAMAYVQAGRIAPGREFLLRRRSGLPVRVFSMAFPLGDIAHGAGAVVGVSAPLAQKRLIERDVSRIDAAIRRRLGIGPTPSLRALEQLRGCGLTDPRFGLRRALPGVSQPLGPLSSLRALHMRHPRPDDLWRLMQRIETYRHRAERLSAGPRPIGQGAKHLARMWLHLADRSFSRWAGSA